MRKPRKIKDIMFTAKENRGFVVYSDLSLEKLRDIPGVVQVHSKINSGCAVTTSPLYDVNEIMEYIKWLACQDQCEGERECDHEERTFTVYCYIPEDTLLHIPGIESVMRYKKLVTHREITVKASYNVGEIKEYIHWLDGDSRFD